mgnify:CR=1 FL=1
MAGVMLVFNGKIIQGTRARKTRSKSFEAFSSINYPLLGMVQDGRIIRSRMGRSRLMALPT